MTNNNTLSPFAAKPKEQLSAQQLRGQRLGDEGETEDRMGDFTESPKPQTGWMSLDNAAASFSGFGAVSDYEKSLDRQNFDIINEDSSTPNATENFSTSGSLAFASAEAVATAHAEEAKRRMESIFNSLAPVDSQPMFEALGGVAQPATAHLETQKHEKHHEGHSFLEKMAENPVVEFFSEKLPEATEKVKEAFEVVSELFLNDILKPFFGGSKKEKPADPKKKANIELSVASREASEQNHEAGKTREQMSAVERTLGRPVTVEEMNQKLGNGNESYEQVFDAYHIHAVRRKEQEELDEILKPKIIETPVSQGQKAINQQQMEGGMKGQSANMNVVNAGG